MDEPLNRQLDRDPLDRTHSPNVMPVVDLRLSDCDRFTLPCPRLPLLLSEMTSHQDFQTALQVLLSMVCRAMGWSVSEVWLPSPDGTVLDYGNIYYSDRPAMQAWIEASQTLHFPLGVGLPGRVWQQRQAEWQRDVSHLSPDLFWRAPIAQTLNLRAALGVPILGRDRVLAVLVFLMQQPCDYNPAVVTLISDLAGLVSQVMEFQATEMALVQSQQRLTRLIDSLPGIVFASSNDPTWSMTYLSEGCLHLLGYTSQELIGATRITTFTEITHPEDVPQVLQTIDQAIAQKRPYVTEYRVRTKAGEEKWLWEKGYGVFAENGEVLGLEGFITDITERKQSERHLMEQEQFLRLVLDNIPQHIFWKDQHLVYRGGNRVWARSLGFEQPEDLVGKTDDDLWLPQVAETFRQRDRHVMSTGLPLLHDLRVRYLPDGTETWQDVSKIPICDADNHVVGVLGTLEDITQRRQAEEALRENEQRYRFLANNATDLICRHTPEGIYLYASPACRLLLGYEPEELIGTSVDRLFHPDDRETIQQARTLALHYPDLDVPPFCYRIRCKDGRYIWFETTGKAVSDPQTGEVQELVSVSRDISDRKRAAQWLKGQTRVLEMIATDCPLTDTLTALVQSIEDQVEGVLGSVLLLDAEGCLRHGAAPSLPDAYNAQIDGIAIGPSVGSCGTAAYYRASVIVADVAQDALWRDYRDLALQFGLRACWSIPILSSHGNVLGTFALYHRVPTQPTSLETRFIETATHLAGIAIERKQINQALTQAEAQYRSIFENAVEGIFQTSLDGRYTAANPMLAQIYGYESPQDLIANLTDIEHQLYVDPDRRREFIQQMQTRGAVWGFESQIYRKDGSRIWVSECSRVVCDAQGNAIGYEGTVEDITQRKRAEHELHRREQLLQGVAIATNYLLTNPDLHTAIPQALAVLGEAAHADRVYIYENHPHFESGVPAMSMQYEWVRYGIAPSIDQSHWQNQPYENFGMERWYHAFVRGESVSGVVRQFPPTERELLERDRILAILMVPIFIDEYLWGFVGFDDCNSERQWSAGDESILVAIAASIGGAIKRQSTEQQMRHQAFHDALTGLPNRSLFEQQLPLAIEYAQQHDEILAIAFLDLDRFKTINDTLGHAVGDKLLKKVTQRLQSCLRNHDLISRWGGDEFTLILSHLKTTEAAASVAQRIVNALKPAFYLEGQELHITGSIGIAVYPQDGTDLKTLLQNADAALYRVKEQGRDNYQFYTSTLNSDASELLTLTNSLHHALKRHEFVLYYQPQVSAVTGEILQLEALLRWKHPELGLISPDRFIPLAEENGLIIPVGEWVLRTVCQQSLAWQRMGLPPIRIAVNLSARQFHQANLVSRIAAILDETGLPPDLLELEITETAVMRDVEFTCEILHELRTMGLHLSVDDFGTGYSSLNYLRKFPLQALKIDRSFVQDLMEDPNATAIIDAVITLGHGLNLRVVAEGVEHPEQAALLRSLHCDAMQGYWVSQPMSTPKTTQFLWQEANPCSVEKICS